MEKTGKTHILTIRNEMETTVGIDTIFLFSSIFLREGRTYDVPFLCVINSEMIWYE